MAGLPRKTLPPDSSALIDGRTGQPKRVTPKVRKAVRLLLDGSCRTLKAAAERVGVSHEYISRALRKPHVLQFVDEQARVQLAAGKMLASARLLELINAQSEHVSFDASAHALAIAGIRPVGDPAVALNVSLAPAGYILDFRDPRETGGENSPTPAAFQRDAASVTIEHQAPKEPEPAKLAKSAAPPFPGMVQTGVTRDGGPRFSFRTADNDEQK